MSAAAALTPSLGRVESPSRRPAAFLCVLPQLLLPLLWPCPAPAQRVSEIGLQALATLSHQSLVGAGMYGGLRFSERGRLVLTAAAGERRSAATFRGEALGHFMLDPRRVSGIGLYGFAGAAWEQGSTGQGYLVLGLGAESAPGSPRGWATEVGVGGGVRIALGYRWRRIPAGWRRGG